MSTPFVEELALESKNNEGIDEVIYLTEEVDGVEIPLNLTGRTFFAQARRGKTSEADLICEIGVAIYGPATDGALRLTVSDAIMKTVDPGRGFYDVLTRVGAGVIDNLYQAPFNVEGGISVWQP
jgi:hypothetical protein